MRTSRRNFERRVDQVLAAIKKNQCQPSQQDRAVFVLPIVDDEPQVPRTIVRRAYTTHFLIAEEMDSL